MKTSGNKVADINENGQNSDGLARVKIKKVFTIVKVMEKTILRLFIQIWC